MAHVISEFPVEPRRRSRRYPWDEWTDGRSWVLVRGEDFDLDTEVFRNKMFAQAARRGLQVHTHKVAGNGAGEPDQLVVQFYGHPEA